MQIFADPIFSDDLLARSKKGDTTAQLELAEAYLYGHGIEADEIKAEYWAEIAAQNGNPNAMYWLADGYVTYAGLIEEDDKNDSLEHFRKAFKWFNKAAEMNHIESMVELADLYTRPDSGLEQNFGKAFELLLNAAISENKQAMRNLAVLYEEGTFVPQDLEIAKKWWDKSKI